MKFYLLLFSILICLLGHSQHDSTGGCIYYQGIETGKKFQIVECDSCVVERFVMTIVSSGKVVTLKSKTNKFTSSMKYEIKKMQKGESIFFDQIYYRNEENKVVKAPQFELKI